MSTPSPSEKPGLSAALGDAFQAGWQRVVADDQHEPMLDRLAAFADGRLSAADEQLVVKEIAESPAAFEILAALVSESDAPRAWPATGTRAVAPVEVAAATPPRELTRERNRSTIAAWAVAASLMVAAWGVMRARSLDGEVAVLNRRAHESAAALSAGEKERLASLDAETDAHFLVGATSPELAEQAMAALGDSMWGQSRGLAMTDEEAAALDEARRRLAGVVNQFDATTLAGQLEIAAALVASGQLEQAEGILSRIEQDAMAEATTQAAWENIRGALAARVAAAAPVREAGEHWEQAEQLFRSAAGRGLNEAWLNLALALVQQDEESAALDAVQRYLSGETDPVRREALERALKQKE